MLTTFVLLGIFLILAVLYILVGVFMIPKFAVTSMPEDIKTVVRSRPDYPKRKTALGYISAVVIFLGLLGVLIYAGIDSAKNNFSFVQVFVRYLILLMGYKAFDIICLDWWLITKSRFFRTYFRKLRGVKGTSSLDLTGRSSWQRSYLAASKKIWHLQQPLKRMAERLLKKMKIIKKESSANII